MMSENCDQSQPRHGLVVPAVVTCQRPSGHPGYHEWSQMVIWGDDHLHHTSHDHTVLTSDEPGR